MFPDRNENAHAEAEAAVIAAMCPVVASKPCEVQPASHMWAQAPPGAASIVGVQSKRRTRHSPPALEGAGLLWFNLCPDCG